MPDGTAHKTDQVKDFRGYALGERNPKTLPGFGQGNESHDENRRNTLRWGAIRAWARRPGGKYVT